MNSEWISAILGGVLIGVSVSLMLLWNGRVVGISGIIYGLLNPVRGDNAWRGSFIFGLIAGGVVFKFLRPETFGAMLATPDWTVPVAGMLVGFGTVLGSGCTSGHGVCGVSRLSPRSVVATVVFIVAGVLMVFLLRKAGVLP